ncbi:MAG: GLPGLI family protein, partial [Bergeyella zoohelcum]|nr:GLPGLI family protein [Bergeyella zoohelcum]
MKNSVLLGMLLAFSVSVFGQTHRLYYSVLFKVVKGMEGHHKEMIVTDINKNTVKSYAAEYIKYDSINRNSKSGNIMFANPYYLERVSKNLNTGVTTNYGNVIGDYFSYETKDDIKWKLHQDIKEISGYKVQKATANFEGRNWEAWFTKDLNISYGPYKFHGLPGLILEIRDENSDYIFQFLQNKVLEKEYDTSGFLEKYYIKDPLKLSLKDVHKLKMNYFLDPFREFKGGKMENYHLGKEKGEVINYSERTL